MDFKRTSSPYLSSIRTSGNGTSIARKSFLLQQQVKRLSKGKGTVNDDASSTPSLTSTKLNSINVKPTKSQRLKSKTTQKPTTTNIESIHIQKMDYFKSLQLVMLPKKEDEERKLQTKLQSLRLKVTTQKGISSSLSSTQKSIKELNETLEAIQKSIKDIRDRVEENEYLLKTAHILNEYSEILKDEQLIAEKDDTQRSGQQGERVEWNQKLRSTQERKRRIIHDYLKSMDAFHGLNDQLDDTPVGPGENNAYSTEHSQDKSTCPATAADPFKFRGSSLCENCGTKDDFFVNDESFLTCFTCGLSKNYFSGDLVSFKEMQTYDFTRRFDYERPNHFSERLAQSQCKENVEIPEDIMNLINAEIKKERITDMTKLTRDIMKNILKKIKLPKYYEHIPLIISKLSGIPPLKFTPDLEEQFLVMFKEIQEPFEKHKPKDRLNCLSYPYILYKFCELLERDEFLSSFPLLKNRDKLYKTDQVWKKICEELQWEFIPTV